MSEATSSTIDGWHTIAYYIREIIVVWDVCVKLCVWGGVGWGWGARDSGFAFKVYNLEIQ